MRRALGGAGVGSPLPALLPQVLKKAFQATLCWLLSSAAPPGCCDLEPYAQLVLGGDPHHPREPRDVQGGVEGRGEVGRPRAGGPSAGPP